MYYHDILEAKVWFLALSHFYFVTECKLPPKGNMLGHKRILNLKNKVLTRGSGWKPDKFKCGKRCTFVLDQGINSQDNIQR